MSDIQALVDALAAELDRPVGVDDRNFRSIAYSPHSDGVDAVRIASILQRRPPQPVREWLESLGIQEADRPLRVPSNAELEMAARVCVPLHFDRIPLGYLWLIDEPEPLGDQNLAEVERYAEEFGVALYRERLRERDDRCRERELVAELTGLRDGDAAAAAAELRRCGYLALAPGYAAMNVAALHEARCEAPDAVRVRLADAAEQTRRAVAPHHVVVLVDGSEVVIALACTSPGELAHRAAAVAATASEALAELPGWRPFVGVGEEVDRLAELGRSQRQARAAGHFAAALGRGDDVAHWDELGAYRTVVQMLQDHDPQDLLPDAFRRLLDSSDAAVLIETLERYLDLGCDTRAAAEALFIHRSSLYGRLHRIEEVAGVDLRSGEHRLELHLGIRLWRLGRGQIEA